MCIQNLKFVALVFPDIIGNTQKSRQSLDTPTPPLIGFLRMDPVNVLAKCEVRSFTHSCDNRGSQKISGRRGSGMLPSESVDEFLCPPDRLFLALVCPKF